MTISSISNRQRTWLRWCPAIFFAIIIFGFSSMLGDEVDKTYKTLDSIALPAATPSAKIKATAQATPKATATKKSHSSTTIIVTITTRIIKPTATAKPLPISHMVHKIPIFSTLELLKVGHAIGYFWLGLTAFYAIGLQSRQSPTIAVTLCTLYAISDEFHQSFVPGRSATIRDTLIDTLAALVGISTLFALTKIRAYFSQKRAPPS